MSRQHQLLAIVVLASLVGFAACEGNEHAQDRPVVSEPAAGSAAPAPQPTAANTPSLPAPSVPAPSLPAPWAPGQPVPAVAAEESAPQAAAAATPVAAERRPSAATRPADANQVTVTARLLGREGRMPHCGVMYVVELMLYEVVGANGGFADGQQIVVAQGCPEFLQAQLGLHNGAPPFFVVGELYDLGLARKYPSTAPERGKPWPTVGGHKIPEDARPLWAEATKRHSPAL